MREVDREYYRQRAATEWEHARTSVDPRVIACHLEFAKRYDLIANSGRPARPALLLLVA